MPSYTQYSTDPAISKAHKDVLNLELQIKTCPPTRREESCSSQTSTQGGSWTYNSQYNTYGMVGGRPVTTRSCGSVAVSNKVYCEQLDRDLILAKQKLEDLERKESQAASNRKNTILNAARQAKQLADDAAALPGLKRDELACDEYKERTRCRQLRERIAAIEKNQAGSPNSQPVNSSNFSNPTQAQPAAQPAALPKPFTQPTSTPTTSRTTTRRTGGRGLTRNKKVSRIKGDPVTRPPRVSSASSG